MTVITSNTYTGDGVTALFPVSFPYIEASDVDVTVDGVSISRVTDWIFTTSSVVQIFNIPAVGQTIKITRNTTEDALKSTFFPGSAIRARDLNDNFTQTLYVVQEAAVTSTDATDQAESAAQAAAAAAASAASAEEDAQAAANTASDALNNSQTALSTASQAVVKADAATVVAVDAGINADAANLKAEQALSSVLDVVPFVIIADVASIPTTPDDNEKIQVTDSTGIESFSPLANLPAGFVGDPGINVTLTFSLPSNTWIYAGYAANDPDSRYSGALDALSTTGGTMTGPIVFSNDQEFPIEDIQDASTTVKGVVQLSNSFTGSSEVLAVTEKALSEGLSSVEIDIESLPALP